jgi:hypothetical protein
VTGSVAEMRLPQSKHSKKVRLVIAPLRAARYNNIPVANVAIVVPAKAYAMMDPRFWKKFF